MAISFLFFAFCLFFPSLVGSTRTLQDHELVVQEVHRELNASRRKLGFLSCGTGNPIDDCWRCDPNWADNRKRLADCGTGFGKGAIGGRDGEIYVVTDNSDPDAVNPTPGTLRYAVTRDAPLWIIFQRDMTIELKQELIINSFKTIDGRGSSVQIIRAGLTIQYVSHVIVHGVNIHDSVPTGNAMVRSSETHYGWRTMADGDAISIFGSSHVWVDHCSLSKCKDGLIDVVQGSTAITISNNYFTHHDEVILLGASDTYIEDKNMQVTVAFNHFGEGLTQRMPRCRLGYFHVVNNDYSHWKMYAIGGSAGATILSQGNKFTAPADIKSLEVTRRMHAPKSEWKNWNWISEGDQYLDGAYFVPSGSKDYSTYTQASSLSAKLYGEVSLLTRDSGVLTCKPGRSC